MGRTKGALCDIKKIGKKNPRKGLILIGGFKKFYLG